MIRGQRSLSVSWQPIAVGVDEVVAETTDFIDGQFSAGVWIEHGGLVDMLPASTTNRLQCYQLGIDIGTTKRRTLFRKVADGCTLNTVRIDQAN